MARDDRRVRRTKTLLQNALTTLLREKDVKDITVSELAALADVNRGTFYCHYRDLYDMVEQIETELFCEFSHVLDAYSESTLRHGLQPILCDVFAFIGRNLNMCAALLNLERDTSFLERLKGTVQDKVTAEWHGLYDYLSDTQRDYTLSFMVGGVMGLIQQWIRKDLGESPQEMAAMAECLISGGIRAMGKP